MNAEEKKLRERAEMIEKSYLFWDEKVYEALERLDSSDVYEEALVSEMEGELQVYLYRADFERREMEKLEEDIRNFVRQNEEKGKE